VPRRGSPPRRDTGSLARSPGGGVGESRARKLNPEAAWAVPSKVRLIRKMLEGALLDALRDEAPGFLDRSAVARLDVLEGNKERPKGSSGSIASVAASHPIWGDGAMRGGVSQGQWWRLPPSSALGRRLRRAIRRTASSAPRRRRRKNRKHARTRRKSTADRSRHGQEHAVERYVRSVAQSVRGRASS
jgi:hypothetical protein